MTDIALPVEQTRAANTLGASDAAAALGLNRYTSPMKLWRQLRGLPVNEEKPAFVQEAADWGQVLEPVIRGKYALERNAAIFVPTHSVILEDWLRCTPDGYVCALKAIGAHHQEEREIEYRGAVAYTTIFPGTYEEKPHRAPDGLLQVKTCSMYKRDEWAEGPPAEYEVQCRVEMAVCDLPWDDITCLIGGQQRVTYRIERDAAIEARILTDLRAFWDRVQSGTEPDVDGSAAWREYASERMRPSKVAIVADDDTNALIANWATARKQRKALQAVEEQHKTELLLKLAAAGATKIESRLGALSAYQTGARTAWREYALSLGGAAKPPAQFKGAPGKWTIRAPGDDDGE